MNASLQDPFSWVVLLIGLALAVYLRKIERTARAAFLLALSLVISVGWAYSHYEMNCVELADPN